MSLRLSESIALGACQQLRLGRKSPSSIGRGLRPRTLSSSSIAHRKIIPRRVRPATTAPLSSHADSILANQRRHFHVTSITRDDKGGDDAAAAPAKTDAENPIAPFTSPKVEALFQKIIWLDMVEVHLLAETINEKMGLVISDAEKERMSRGGGGGGGSKSDDGEEAAEEVKEEKTAFDLKLMGFDAKSKIKVIKEVRSMTSLGLKEAKELVEGAPSTVKKDIKKEEAEELKGKLEALGAQVEIV